MKLTPEQLALEAVRDASLAAADAAQALGAALAEAAGRDEDDD